MAKILIVDDSSFSRRTLRKILEPAGHAIVEAEDGMTAIEQYFLDAPDLVFLDMNMRGMHGLEVLSKLRELDPQASIVVATADVQSSTRTMVASEGAKAFIAKPFAPNDILTTVDTLLGGGSA
ncbi:MAG TPA: response regulator [Herpetosiphonaceae bacterium]